jgi:aspartate dehydrogenase
MRLGIIGCGAIGSFVAQAIEEGVLPNTHLQVIYDVKVEKAYGLQSLLSKKPDIAFTFEDFIKHDIDIVLEAASQEALKDYAFQILESDKDLVAMSAGAFADEEFRHKLFDFARLKNRKIYIPSGAVAGLDGLKALSYVKISKAKLTTRKPPAGLGKEVNAPETLFKGSAIEAAKLFPQNINVAVALGLAGDILEKLEVEVIVDPRVKNNEHTIEVKSEAAELKIVLKNKPFPQNSKTSFLAALSCLQVLRNISSNVIIGG